MPSHKITGPSIKIPPYLNKSNHTQFAARPTKSKHTGIKNLIDNSLSISPKFKRTQVSDQVDRANLVYFMNLLAIFSKPPRLPELAPLPPPLALPWR